MVLQSCHSEEKTFVCPVCSRRFARHYDMRLHRETHAENGMRKCAFCPKMYLTSRALKEHELDHTKVVRERCPVCAKHFTTAKKFNAHMKTHNYILTNNLHLNPSAPNDSETSSSDSPILRLSLSSEEGEENVATMEDNYVLKSVTSEPCMEITEKIHSSLFKPEVSIQKRDNNISLVVKSELYDESLENNSLQVNKMDLGESPNTFPTNPLRNYVRDPLLQSSNDSMCSLQDIKPEPSIDSLDNIVIQDIRTELPANNHIPEDVNSDICAEPLDGNSNQEDLKSEYRQAESLVSNHQDIQSILHNQVEHNMLIKDVKSEPRDEALDDHVFPPDVQPEFHAEAVDDILIQNIKSELRVETPDKMHIVQDVNSGPHAESLDDNGFQDVQSEFHVEAMENILIQNVKTELRVESPDKIHIVRDLNSGPLSEPLDDIGFQDAQSEFQVEAVDNILTQNVRTELRVESPDKGHVVRDVNSGSHAESLDENCFQDVQSEFHVEAVDNIIIQDVRTELRAESPDSIHILEDIKSEPQDESLFDSLFHESKPDLNNEVMVKSLVHDSKPDSTKSGRQAESEDGQPLKNDNFDLGPKSPECIIIILEDDDSEVEDGSLFKDVQPKLCDLQSKNTEDVSPQLHEEESLNNNHIHDVDPKFVMETANTTVAFEDVATEYDTGTLHKSTFQGATSEPYVESPIDNTFLQSITAQHGIETPAIAERQDRTAEETNAEKPILPDAENIEKINRFICHLCGTTFRRRWSVTRHLQLACKVKQREKSGISGPYLNAYAFAVQRRLQTQGHSRGLNKSWPLCQDSFSIDSPLAEHIVDRPSNSNTWEGASDVEATSSHDNHSFASMEMPGLTTNRTLGGEPALQEQIIPERTSPHTGILYPFRDQTHQQGLNQEMHGGANAEVTREFIESAEKLGKNRRRVECDICHKTLKDRTALKYHYRIHTGEKPHVCPICRKAFARNQHLRTHKLTHLTKEERMKRCAFCTKTFLDPTSLKKHEAHHKKGVMYYCPICGKAFRTLLTHEQHIVTHKNDTLIQELESTLPGNDQSTAVPEIPVLIQEFESTLPGNDQSTVVPEIPVLEIGSSSEDEDADVTMAEQYIPMQVFQLEDSPDDLEQEDIPGNENG